jgi:hypothetical protein
MKQMNTSLPRNCGIRYGALGLALLLACPALAYKGEKLAKDAKISIAEARAIALKAHPGKITDEELERESGGTGLRYSFVAVLPRMRSALTRKQGAYWRTPRRVKIPINKSIH